MSTVKADNFTWKTGEATAQSGTTVTGPQIVYGVAKVWFNFNGTGTIASRASFNVSSLTDVGASLYLVNFSTSLIDANHATTCNCQPNNYSGSYAGSGDTAAGTQTSSRASVELRDTNNAYSDSNFIVGAVFR